MAKPEWGIKRICHSCGTRYYDLRHDPIVCPSCGTEYDPDAFLRSRRSRSTVVEEAPARAVARKAPSREDLEETAELEEASLENISSEAATTDDEEGETLENIETGDEDFSDDDSSGQEMLEDASELGDDEDVPIDVDEGEDEER